MFHNLAVPVLHLFILIVKFLSLYVDELNDDDDVVVEALTVILCLLIVIPVTMAGVGESLTRGWLKSNQQVMRDFSESACEVFAS